MKKCILLFLALSSLILVGCNENSDEVEIDSLEGDGSESNPFKLDSAKDFEALDAVIEGNTNHNYYYVSLESDIDLKDSPFTGFGSSTRSFYGSFDGKDHTIKNFNINTFDVESDDKGYGLFKYAKESIITSLNLEYSIDFEIKGGNQSVYVGGLVGYGDSVELTNIFVTGNSNVYTYSSNVQLCNGGVIGCLSSANLYAVDIDTVSHVGDVISTTNQDTTCLSFNGGICGYTTTNYGNGTIAFMSNYQVGNVVSEDSSGGILGRADYYVSIQDSVAKGDYVKSSIEDGAYAGGICGICSYETLVGRNYVEYDEISATTSSSSEYSSIAGAIVGSYTVDDVDNGNYDSYLGTGNYSNYYNVDKVSGTYVGINGEKISLTSVDEIISKVGLSSSWSGGDTFTLNKFEDSSYIATLKSGFDEFEDTTVSLKARQYSRDTYFEIKTSAPQKEGYSFYNYFYDEDLTCELRLYVPFVSDTTLYAGYGDLSEIIGTYNYQCNSVEGTWVFTNEYFYWINNYYETFIYEYTYFDNAIYIGNGGTYSNEIILIVDGALTIPDINDSDYLYYGYKSNTNYEFVDYSNEKFIGNWYCSKGTQFILYADGNADGYYTSTYSGIAMLSSGGYRENDGTLDIKISSVCYGKYNYDSTNEVLVGVSTICLRDSFSVLKTYSYSSSDLNVFIYVLEGSNKEYVVINSKLSSYSGTLSNGEEITIDSYTFKVNGTSLELVSPKDEGDDDKNDDNDFSIFGTWKDTNGNTFVFNKDYTASFSNSSSTFDFTFTFDSTSLKGTLSDVDTWSGDNTLSYDSSSSTLTVFLDDEYDDNDCTLKFTKESDDTNDSVDSSSKLVGTWVSGDINLVINSDGTGTYNNGTNYDITVDLDSGKVDGTPFDEGTVFVKYDEDNDTLTFSFEQDYEGPYTLTFTRSN